VVARSDISSDYQLVSDELKLVYWTKEDVKGENYTKYDRIINYLWSANR